MSNLHLRDRRTATLPDGDPRRVAYMTTHDRPTARLAARLLPVSDRIARRWGVVSATVGRNAGHPPPVLDTLLAATALDYELYLATQNVRDVRHGGAAIGNPWDDDATAFPIVPKSRRRRAPAS